MFSLIITVISIALVAALALATLYFGGSAYNQGAAKADAAKILLQGQQLIGASELYLSGEGHWPKDLAELKTSKYLTSTPQARAMQAAVEHAQAAGAEWVMPKEGTPMFLLPAVAAKDVCRYVNVQGSLKNNGIPKVAYSGLAIQCFGESLYQVVIKKDADTPLTGGIPEIEVGANPLPSTDSASPDWAVPPGGPTASSTDPAVNPSPNVSPPQTATDTANATQNTQVIRIAVPVGNWTLTAGTDGVVPGTSTSDDTYIRLFYNGVEVADNDDNLNSGSYLSYSVPDGGQGDYELHVGCYGSSSCTFTTGYLLVARPNAPVIPPPLDFAPVFSQSQVVFPGVQIDSIRTQQVTVQNNTGESATLLNLFTTQPLVFNASLSGQAPSCGSLPGGALPAGDTCQFSISFRPQQLGESTQTLTLEGRSRDGWYRIHLPLSGTGVTVCPPGTCLYAIGAFGSNWHSSAAEVCDVSAVWLSTRDLGDWRDYTGTVSADDTICHLYGIGRPVPGCTNVFCEVGDHQFDVEITRR